MTFSDYRPTARIAWRQARRSPWRSALVVAMVALPIAILALAAVVIRTANPTAEERVTGQMGTSELQVYPNEGFDAARLQAALPDGTRLISIRNMSVEEIRGGSYLGVTLEEPSVDPRDPAVGGRYAVLDGRLPLREGEAAVHPKTLSVYDARVGDLLELPGVLPLRIVGVAVHPEEFWSPLVLTAPGTLDATDEETWWVWWLVDVDPGMLDEAIGVLGAELSEGSAVTRDEVAMYTSDGSLLATGASFAITIVALFGTGLIAAAAFVVGARRQLRALGLIGAAGGEPRHVMATVLLGGLSLGLLGSLVGTALGIAGAFVLHPRLNSIVGRLVGPIDLPWTSLAGGILLGSLAAVAAAYAPARSAARLSVVEALSGRTRPPHPPGRWARRGAVAAAAGTGAVALGTASSNTIVLGVGVVVTLIGFLLGIPVLIEAVGRAARWLPTTARLAARQTARYGRRTGAAMAAATLALTLPIAVSALTLSEEAAEARNAPMGDDHLLVGMVGPGSSQGEPTDALLQDLRNLFPGAILAALRPGVFRVATEDPAAPFEEWTAFVEGGVDQVGEGFVSRASGTLMVGTPDVLRAIHAEAGLGPLAEGIVVAIGENATDGGVVRLHVPPETVGDVVEPEPVEVPAVKIDAPDYFNETLPHYLISEEAAAEFGMEAGSSGLVLLRAPEALTEDQIAAAKAVAERHPGAYVQSTADYLPDAGAYRLLLTAISTAVALAIVAVAVSLVAAETRRDYAIMVAVGAEPATRRKLVGTNAFLVAALAGVLAVPAGFLPVAVVQGLRTAPLPVVVPWMSIGVVGLVLPAVAGLLAAAVSRQPKAGRMLQPVW